MCRAIELFTSLDFTSLHFTSLHFTSLHLTSPHSTPLHFTPLRSTPLHSTPLHPPHLPLSPTPSHHHPPLTPPGYNKATHLSHFRNLATPHNRTIHAPSSYITYATPAQRASDAREACARECVALTAAGTNCVLFNVYERVVAGASNGTVCAFFGAVEGVDTATKGGDASVAFRDASAWAVFDWDVYRG